MSRLPAIVLLCLAFWITPAVALTLSQQEQDWLAAQGPGSAAARRRDLVGEILALARGGRTSVRAVEEYLWSTIGPDASSWSTTMPTDLWRIGLFPDAELPNYLTGLRRRLEKNVATKLDYRPAKGE